MTIRMYGTLWCSDCKRAKQFFGEQRVQYEFVDIDANADGMRIVEEANGGKDIIPTIIFDDGSVLTEPSNAELAAKLGLQTRAGKRTAKILVTFKTDDEKSVVKRIVGLMGGGPLDSGTGAASGKSAALSASAAPPVKAGP